MRIPAIVRVLGFGAAQTVALLPAQAPVPAPSLGELRVFTDWVVGCDNTWRCMAESLYPEADPTRRGPPIVVARESGPDGAVEVSVTLYETATTAVDFVIDGTTIATAHVRRDVAVVGGDDAQDTRHGDRASGPARGQTRGRNRRSSVARRVVGGVGIHGRGSAARRHDDGAGGHGHRGRPYGAGWAAAASRESCSDRGVGHAGAALRRRGVAGDRRGCLRTGVLATPGGNPACCVVADANAGARLVPVDWVQPQPRRAHRHWRSREPDLFSGEIRLCAKLPNRRGDSDHSQRQMGSRPFRAAKLLQSALAPRLRQLRAVRLGRHDVPPRGGAGDERVPVRHGVHRLVAGEVLTRDAAPGIVSWSINNQ